MPLSYGFTRFGTFVLFSFGPLTRSVSPAPLLTCTGSQCLFSFAFPLSLLYPQKSPFSQKYCAHPSSAL